MPSPPQNVRIGTRRPPIPRPIFTTKITLPYVVPSTTNARPIGPVVATVPYTSSLFLYREWKRFPLTRKLNGSQLPKFVFVFLLRPA